MCADCGIFLCRLCSITSMEDKKIRCINCYLKSFSPDWNKLNQEFKEMLECNKDVLLKEKEKEINAI